MKKVIFFLASVSVVAVCIHQGFSDPRDNMDEIMSSGRTSAVSGTAVNLSLDDLKSMTSSSSSKISDENIDNTIKARVVCGATLDEVRDYAHIAAMAYESDDAVRENEIVKKMIADGYKLERMTDCRNGRDCGIILLKGNNAFISYRGTVPGVADLLTDVNCPKESNPFGKGQVHAGFLSEFKASEDSAFEAIYKHSYNNGIKLSDMKIVLTGHSLGAAVATIAASKLLSVGANPENMRLQTYASPRVGTEEFANELNGTMGDRILRIAHVGDIVPGVGIKSMGFVHAGYAIDLKPVEGLSGSLHFISNYIASLNNLKEDEFFARKDHNVQGWVKWVIDQAAGNTLGVAVSGVAKGFGYLFGTKYNPVAPENRIPQELFNKNINQVVATLKDTSAQDRNRLSSEQKDLLEDKEASSLMVIAQIINQIEYDESIRSTLTPEQLALYSGIKDVYHNFKNAVINVETMGAKIDDMLKNPKQNADGLKDYSAKMQDALKALEVAQRELVSYITSCGVLNS